MGAVKWRGEYKSWNNSEYTIDIWDTDYSSSPLDFSVGEGGCVLKYSSSGNQKLSPILAGTLEIPFIVENVLQNTWINLLRTTKEEKDIYVHLYEYSTLIWSGFLIMDLSSEQDEFYPFEVKLKAVDGIGLLKDLDFIPDNANITPYTKANTYMTSSYGYQTIIEWLAEVLDKVGLADSTTGGGVDYTIQTAVNWYNADMPSMNQADDPLKWTQVDMTQAYTLLDANSTTTLLYEAKSCYHILENLCKLFGMRVVYWNNVVHFIQPSQYQIDESGTIANPVNIPTRIYDMSGAFVSSQAFLGNAVLSAYDLEAENATNPGEGINKLSGGKWGAFPPVRQVIAGWRSITNISFYQCFPEIYGQDTSTNPATDTGDTTSCPIGTLNDFTSFDGLYLQIYLNINNPLAFPVDIDLNWTIRARPSTATAWTAAAGALAIDCDWSTFPIGTYRWYEYYEPDMNYIQNGTEWIRPGGGFPGGSINVPNASGLFYQRLTIQPGMSNHNIVDNTYASSMMFPMRTIPPDSSMTGSWDFEIVTWSAIWSYDSSWSGHGSVDSNASSIDSPFDSGTQPAYPTGQIFRTQSTIPSNMNLISPVFGGNISAIGTTTSYTISTPDSYKMDLGDMLWGDTDIIYGTSIKVWNGTSFVGSNHTGTWGAGTLSGNDTITELLCRDALNMQSVPSKQLNATFACGNTEKERSPGYPKYMNPIGRFLDVYSVPNVMMEGTFTTGKDEWSGKWFEMVYDSTTGTTTSTGTGQIPTDDDSNNADMKLAPPGSGNAMSVNRQRGFEGLTFTTELFLMQTAYESIDIQALGTAVLKAGDKVDLFDFVSKQKIRLTLSADQGATDTSISVDAFTPDKNIASGAILKIAEDDLASQYQHKTRGTINISDYSFTERNTDPADPIEGNSVMWLSDGTQTGDDGDMLVKTQAGGDVTNYKFDLTEVTPWTPPPPGWSNSYSLLFDGVDDYLLIASGFKTGATTSSFSVWFKKSTSMNDDIIMSAGYPYVSDFSYWVDSGNRVRIDHPLYGSCATFAYTLPDGTAWYHLVVTLNQEKGEMKFYINGDLKDTKSEEVAVDEGSTPCYIGRWANGTWGIFGGHIDEVGNWSSTLSAAEVTAIYNSGEPTDLNVDAGDYESSANLNGYWRNGDPDGTSEYPTIEDASDESNDATMTNMVDSDITEDVPS